MIVEEVILEEKPLNISVAAIPKQKTEPTNPLHSPHWNVECMTEFENTLIASDWEQTEHKNAAQYYDSIGHAF